MAAELEAAVPVPKGWEPYAEEAGRIGSAIVRLPSPGATERDLLIGAGFDPDCWVIQGNVNTRRWMRYDQEWLYYYKFDVAQGESLEVVEEHIDDLVRRIRRRRAPHKYAAPDHADDAWGIMGSDWQIGKRVGDRGTPWTIDGILECVDLAKAEVKDLRRNGYAIPTGFFAGTGDLGEGTCGFYPNQQYLIDRNRRDQNRIIRELITHTIDELAPLFEEFHVLTVGGNHGENRNDGKKSTDDGDNDDVAQFEAVREAYDRAEQHGWDSNLMWHIPNDELSISSTFGGVRVGFAHGHTFGSGTTAQVKAHKWWKDQDFGFQEVRDTQILISSHFHHNSEVTYGRRTHIQTPAMDPGSEWYTNRTGEDSPRGTLTLRLSEEEALGFSHKRILAPQS